MAVDMGQALMLTLAVPAVCLLLFVLTRLEQWLARDEDPYLRGQTAVGAGEGGQAQPMPAPPGAVDAAAARQAGDEGVPGTVPPGGMSEASRSAGSAPHRPSNQRRGDFEQAAGVERAGVPPGRQHAGGDGDMRVHWLVPGCPEKWFEPPHDAGADHRGRAGRAARSGPRETRHPAALDGLAYVRAPRVAKGLTPE